MSDLVSIAGGAVAAYQRALGTVSNNIANVDSAGYTRQEASLIENAPRSYGTSYLGTGVNVLGIKRMYDAFIENSLRSANTELGTQESLVNYANRVVDILGSEDVGLLSAFDQFFDAARQLATDSSSVILREQFISKADALTSRFKTLNSQLTLVAQETQEAIRSEVSSLNSLSEQLTLVNTQLGKTKLLNRQPPALMDQRDEILRQMASLAKINVTEMQNGQVKVAIGASSTRGEIVSLTDFRPLTAVFNPSSVGKVDLVIDAGSPRAENVIGFSGGSISGLMSFRSQLLEPGFDSLDSLAKTLLTSVNEIHAEGIDLEGRDGGALFQIDPRFSLKASSGETDVRFSAEVVDLQAFEANQLRLDYRANAGQTSSIALSGEFRAGDQMNVNLNGSEKRFVITGADEGDVVPLSEVQSQLRNFLEGGNGSSVGGAFGLQIDAREGAGTDILVSSSLLGAFNLSVTAISEAGRIDESVSRGLWTLTDTVTGQSASGVTSLALNGIQIQLSGEPRDGEILFLDIANSAAAGISVAIDDPARIAAASRFRVIENQFNPSRVSALLSETPQTYPDDQTLWIDRLIGDAPALEPLDNNILESAAISFNGPKPTPIAIVPEGFTDTTLYLGDLDGEEVNLHVVTREGRHLLGQRFEPTADRVQLELQRLGVNELDDDQMSALYAEAGDDFLSQAKLAGVSFTEQASYSADYLNASGEGSYRDLDLFYGVKAAVQNIARLTVDHVYGEVEEIPASIEGGAINSIVCNVGDVIFSEGDLTYNGVSMGALSIEEDQDGNVRLGLTRTNEFGVSAMKYLSVTGASFEQNADGDYLLEAEHLKAYFDAHHFDEETGLPVDYASGGIWAELRTTSRMDVAVETRVTEDGDEYSVLTFGRTLSTEQDAESIDSEIRIGLGPNGVPAQLAQLGFRTGVYLTGQMKEDLLVFATGPEGAAFELGATYTTGSRDAITSLRQEPFEVVFTAPDRYQILDVTTNTVVTERHYDPLIGIQYRGLTLSLNAEPLEGDRFRVDGNQDGIGNNETALRLAALQNERIVGGGGGYTLSEAYGNLVGDIGNTAFQASISQKALEVVKDQAVQARDKVSGVSLDQEAADLIRYQQAYQASAKVMQTANTLFDAILGIR